MRNDAEMPGAWICDRCNFVLQKSILFAGDGSVAADTSPLNEVCPNDGQLMRPLTWREVNKQYSEDNDKLRTQLAEANEKCAKAEQACREWALGVTNSNTDIVDMQRDEFKRIMTLTENAEIKDICQRAIATIEQTVPVVVQRDHLLQSLLNLTASNEKLENDLWVEKLKHATWSHTFQKYQSWKANKVPPNDWPDAVIADYEKCSKSSPPSTTLATVKKAFELLQKLHDGCGPISLYDLNELLDAAKKENWI